MALGLKNVEDIFKLMEWNCKHYIECLRISSDLFPHYTNIHNITEDDRYSLDFAQETLQKVGEYARKHGQRLTMHPGQFNVIGTPHEKAFEGTISDLKMHADVLDMMGMDMNSVLVVHGGGTYGDKEKTIERWKRNFWRLPENVRRRLVIENCEKNFSIADCLKISEAIGIPVVFDNHHFECYRQLHEDEKFDDPEVYIKAVIERWVCKGIRPKFHMSEQNEEKHVGAHSDYIESIPGYYLEIPEKYGIGIDIMVEAKAKEAAILKLYTMYRKVLLGHIRKIDEELLLQFK